MKVLVIEDEPELAAVLVRSLERERYVVEAARINRSLVLLGKLENREFTPEKDICLSTAVNDSLRSFSELMEMKGLGLRTEVQTDVQVPCIPRWPMCCYPTCSATPYATTWTKAASLWTSIAVPSP